MKDFRIRGKLAGSRTMEVLLETDDPKEFEAKYKELYASGLYDVLYKERKL